MGGEAGERRVWKWPAAERSGYGGRGEAGQLSHHSKESRYYPVRLREPLNIFGGVSDKIF